MIDKRTLFEIHRLQAEGLSQRKIARQLSLSRQTVKRHLLAPQTQRKKAPKPSKLDPFKIHVLQWLQIDPTLSATVVLQRLEGLGFEGKYSIVKDYLRKTRPKPPLIPIRRFESQPGEQFQIDWGVFGKLCYGNSQRNLYALAVIECHSRKLFVYFTHSMDQAALHQSLLAAFQHFEGTPRELVFDNMKTAVTERVGAIIRFNSDFLDFLRPFQVKPTACRPRLPRSKGKVERVIRYIRDNFWPLRQFKDLADVQSQMNDWLKTVANARLHQTILEKPDERFQPQALRALPSSLPDCYFTRSVSVMADATVAFDSNYYSVPDWTLGHRLILKADQYEVMIFVKERRVAHHLRCWQHKQCLENPKHRKNIKNAPLPDPDCVYFVSLSPCCQSFLEGINQSGIALQKTIKQLLQLLEQYGEGSLLIALEKAVRYKAFGVDYVKNILYQEMTPVSNQPPVVLKQEELNQIRLEPHALAEYDAIVMERNKEH